MPQLECLKVGNSHVDVMDAISAFCCHFIYMYVGQVSVLMLKSASTLLDQK